MRIFVSIIYIFLIIQVNHSFNSVQVIFSVETPYKFLKTFKFWRSGFCGQNVKIGILDTGLNLHNLHFKFTNSEDIDGNGHGSFVSAIISASPIKFRKGYFSQKFFDFDVGKEQCPVIGIAPLSTLYVYKVFTDNQVKNHLNLEKISTTNWFLEAFDTAVKQELDVINLSIGGPDYLDYPFIEKVREITSHDILLVSAIGNDGPKLGTLSNPGDQIEVLSVGGLDISQKKLASYSSRGMTLWELSSGGYGRVKPDIVAPSEDIISASITNDFLLLSRMNFLSGEKNDQNCQKLSGTSVASPIVTAAVSLVINSIKSKRNYLDFYNSNSIRSSEKPPLNPAGIRQILMASAKILPKYSMYEQGSGVLDIRHALKIARIFKPQVTLFPSYLDYTQIPYMWPFCDQPLYYKSIPQMINITIFNSMSITGRFLGDPVYHPITSKNGECLSVKIQRSSLIFPYTGWMAISLQVKDTHEKCIKSDFIAEGYISLTILSDSIYTEPIPNTSDVKFPLRVSVVKRPKKEKIILWDQFHNINYPPYFIPKDDLITSSIGALDSSGDHIHTNYKDLFIYLRNNGFHIEVLNEPITRVNLSEYGTLIICDAEDIYHPDEKAAVQMALENKQINLLVLADWFNKELSDQLNFFDSNKRRRWYPDMSGSNIPGYNYLLDNFNISFSNDVFHGPVLIQELSFTFGTGNALSMFPGNKMFNKEGTGHLLFANPGLLRLFPSEGNKNDNTLGKQKSKNILRKPVSLKESKDIALAGFWSPKSGNQSGGRIAVIGDSTFAEIIHLSSSSSTNRFALFGSILKYLTKPTSPEAKRLVQLLKKISSDTYIKASSAFNQSIGNLNVYPNFSKFSKTIKRNIDTTPLDLLSLKRDNDDSIKYFRLITDLENPVNYFTNIPYAPIYELPIDLDVLVNDIELLSKTPKDIEIDKYLDEDLVLDDQFCQDSFNSVSDSFSHLILDRRSIFYSNQGLRLILGIFFIWSALFVIIFRVRVNRFIAILIYKIVSNVRKIFCKHETDLYIYPKEKNNPVRMNYEKLSY